MNARVLPDLPDDQLCAAPYPAIGAFLGSLCNEVEGHDGNHWALAVVAGAYRRYVVWTAAGEVLPDEETSPAATAQGQTPPIEGERVT